MSSNISFLPPSKLGNDSTSLVRLVLLITDIGLTKREEQHIIQNTIARNKYPFPWNEVLLDLLTSLRESRSLSWLRVEVVSKSPLFGV